MKKVTMLLTALILMLSGCSNSPDMANASTPVSNPNYIYPLYTWNGTNWNQITTNGQPIGIIEISDINGLQAALNSKGTSNVTLPITIADTTGLQTELNSKGTSNVTMLSKTLLTNQSTTSTSLVDIPTFNINLSANTKYFIHTTIYSQASTGTNGIKYGVSVNQTGVGDVIFLGLTAIGGTTATATTADVISSNNTATTNAYTTVALTSRPTVISGTILVGNRPVNVSVKYLKVTSGTATVYAYSNILVFKMD